MSKIDLTLVRKTLIDEQVSLTVDIQNERDQLQQHVEGNPDVFDLADKRRHQEIAASRLSLMNQRVEQVRAALKRLDEGKYGICARCDKDINPERLKAIPYTTFCVSCQEQLERANR
ncbi:MAG TPA: TraR/DksA C4-type zinc finger protein [Anaerolineales bacterium]|nr:TraR/DksA C4-type zinc finger protein [Anaerolineales bacterium]